MNPPELFRHIAQVIPAFRPILEDHLQNFQPLLAHILMTELLHLVGSAFETPKDSASTPAISLEEAQKILSLLDEGMLKKDPATENAIGVSFIEGIEERSFFSALEPWLGPELRKELEQQRAWWKAYSEGRGL